MNIPSSFLQSFWQEENRYQQPHQVAACAMHTKGSRGSQQGEIAEKNHSRRAALVVDKAESRRQIKMLKETLTVCAELAWEPLKWTTEKP